MTVFKTAVLLTVHNRKDKTLECLKRLYSCSFPEGVTFDVFLTDDGCTDGTAQSVRDSFPEVVIVEGDGNLFWNRGMIAAWEAADRQGQYDAYLWLNDDTFVFGSMPAVMFNCAERHPDSIIVGAICSEKDGGITYGGTIKDKHFVPDGNDLRVETLNGNVVLVPSSVKEKIGILDRRFSHAMGDTEYGFRARKYGIEVWQSPEYVGTCELHDRKPDWCNPEVPFRKRWKSLYSPLGCNPKQFFICDRHNGLIKACFHYCSIHVRAMFPGLWHK